MKRQATLPRPACCWTRNPVLELVELAESRITDEELQALHQVIGELGDYIRRTAPGPNAMRLLLHAKRIVGW